MAWEAHAAQRHRPAAGGLGLAARVCWAWQCWTRALAGRKQRDRGEKPEQKPFLDADSPARWARRHARPFLVRLCLSLFAAALLQERSGSPPPCPITACSLPRLPESAAFVLKPVDRASAARRPHHWTAVWLVGLDADLSGKADARLCDVATERGVADYEVSAVVQLRDPLLIERVAAERPALRDQVCVLERLASMTISNDSPDQLNRTRTRRILAAVANGSRAALIRRRPLSKRRPRCPSPVVRCRPDGRINDQNNSSRCSLGANGALWVGRRATAWGCRAGLQRQSWPSCRLAASAASNR
jgi:hypothetical protein